MTTQESEATMSSTGERLSGPGASTASVPPVASPAPRRNRWALPVALGVLGGVAGGLVGYGLPPEYTAETRLAVGPETFAAQSVPGFASASQTLAANYARYVVDTNDGVAALEEELGLAEGSLTGLQASPIPQSNIVRVEVEAPSEDDALAAASAAGQQLLDEVNSPPAESTDNLDRLLATSEALAAQQQVVGAAEAALNAAAGGGGDAAAVEAARRTLVQEQGRLRVAQVEQQVAEEIYRNQYQEGVSTASVSLVREATITDDTRTANAQWGALAGLALGLLVAWIVSGARRRSGRRGAGQERTLSS